MHIKKAYFKIYLGFQVFLNSVLIVELAVEPFKSSDSLATVSAANSPISTTSLAEP